MVYKLKPSLTIQYRWPKKIQTFHPESELVSLESINRIFIHLSFYHFLENRRDFFLGQNFLNGNLDLHFTVKSKEIRLNSNSEHFNVGDG